MRHYTIEIADDVLYFKTRKYIVYRDHEDLSYHDKFSDARAMLGLIRFTDQAFGGAWLRTSTKGLSYD